jgi:hypothetical protein
MDKVKENSGALFRNDRKEKDTHPDYKGTIRVDGQDYWISGWMNESGKGVKYMGLSVQPKEEQAKKPVHDNSAFEEDSIPF